MDFLMLKIILLSIIFGIINHPLLVLLILLAIIIFLVAHLQLRLSSVIFYTLMGILFLYGFIKDAEDASLRTKNSPNIYTNDPKNQIPNMENTNIYEGSTEKKFENNTNTQTTNKNLNKSLENSENLRFVEQKKLEKLHEKRIKQLMDERGKSIIEEYNMNNPQPSSLNQNEISVDNSSLQTNEKNQTKPKDSFIEILK